MESFDEGSGAGSSSTAEWFCNGSGLTHAHRRFIPSVSVALAGTTSWRCAWLQLLAYPIETPFCCMLSHVGMLPWCQSLQRAPLPGAARAGRQILCERQRGPLSGEASCTVFLAAPLEQSHMNDTHCKSSRCQPGPLPGGRRSRECCARCALRCDLVSTGPRFHILCYRESHPSLLTQEVNLADTANVAASPGLLKFARDNKLWDPSQGPLNFFRAFHTDTPADHRCAQPRFRGSFADARCTCFPRSLAVLQSGVPRTHAAFPTSTAEHLWPVACRSSYPRRRALQSFFGCQPSVLKQYCC